MCGNYLPKCKQNYTVGIKLPWTLNSEENWNKTHRLGGYVWMAGGLILCILTWLNIYRQIATIVIVVIISVIPIVYSFLLYKKGI
nr:SdpI family protein [Clostridium massiliodielmoense]